MATDFANLACPTSIFARAQFFGKRGETFSERKFRRTLERRRGTLVKKPHRTLFADYGYKRVLLAFVQEIGRAHV